MPYELLRCLNSAGNFDFSRSDITRYYDTHQSSYSRFWSRTALHYGFWYDDTKSLAEAIINTNKFVSDILGIGPDDLVLDAGCGVGGTSTYIAEETGAHVVGITLSGVQLRLAQQRAKDSSATNLLTFSQQDYTCTEFPNATFLKVFGIESVCYASDKLDFLAEAYRTMKDGGRIAVVDTFLKEGTLDPAEREIYKKFLYGWVVPNLSTESEFHGLMREVGFTKIKFYDMQIYVEPSIMTCYRFSLLTAPWNLLKSRLGFSRENLSARYQKLAFDQKIVHYGVFVAEKPV